jgi:hypothetical protein
MKSIGDEIELANENLKLLEVDAVNVPASGTDQEKLLAILMAYRRAMLDAPVTLEALAGQASLLQRVVVHTKAITERLH